LSTVAYFNLSHLHFAPLLGVKMFEFHRDLWRQKIRVPGLSCGIFQWFCINRFDTILACDRQTDTWR